MGLIHLKELLKYQENMQNSSQQKSTFSLKELMILVIILHVAVA